MDTTNNRYQYDTKTIYKEAELNLSGRFNIGKEERTRPACQINRKKVESLRTFGYVRVSSRDQNEERQLIAMKEAGVEKKHIFMDKLSGKDFNRPEYQRLVGTLRSGDLLVIKSIDRLERNYDEILEQLSFSCSLTWRKRSETLSANARGKASTPL